MARAKHKLQRRKSALERIDQLMREPSVVNVVHYSCESFYNRPDGSTPRITSIAVRNLGSRQNRSFSVHQVAEREHIQRPDVPAHYDLLERKMLDGFYELVHQQSGYYWVHWNMRDSSYGFPALEHRYRVLGGVPVQILDVRQVDLAALTPDLYGPNYVPVPRLDSLIALNEITKRDYLAGSEEAAAFTAGEYHKMHMSTLRKVDVIADILNRIWDGTLKTNTSWKDRYGTTLGGIVEAVTDHWAYKLLGFIGIVASLVGLATLL
jgi:hypothetical protein